MSTQFIDETDVLFTDSVAVNMQNQLDDLLRVEIAEQGRLSDIVDALLETLNTQVKNDSILNKKKVSSDLYETILQEIPYDDLNQCSLLLCIQKINVALMQSISILQACLDILKMIPFAEQKHSCATEIATVQAAISRIQAHTTDESTSPKLGQKQSRLYKLTAARNALEQKTTLEDATICELLQAELAKLQAVRLATTTVSTPEHIRAQVIIGIRDAVQLKITILVDSCLKQLQKDAVDTVKKMLIADEDATVESMRSKLIRAERIREVLELVVSKQIQNEFVLPSISTQLIAQRKKIIDMCYSDKKLADRVKQKPRANQIEFHQAAVGRRMVLVEIDEILLQYCTRPEPEEATEPDGPVATEVTAEQLAPLVP